VPAVAAPNQPKNFLRVIDIISSSLSILFLKEKLYWIRKSLFHHENTKSEKHENFIFRVSLLSCFRGLIIFDFLVSSVPHWN
jgi:hypothetical protein